MQTAADDSAAPAESCPFDNRHFVPSSVPAITRSFLTTQTARCSQMLVPIYQITRCHVSQDRILGYNLCPRVSLRANQITNHAGRYPSITNSGKATSYPCQPQCHGLWPNTTGVSVQKFIALKVRLPTSELSNSWHAMNSTLWSNPDCIQKFNDRTQRM